MKNLNKESLTMLMKTRKTILGRYSCKGEVEMNKNILFLVILTSTMLVGWSPFVEVTDTYDPSDVVSGSQLVAEGPDFPLDGRFFEDLYVTRSDMGMRIDLPDYREDGKVFVDMFLSANASGVRLEFVDYPADAKVFNEAYLNTSVLDGNPDYPDYPLDGKIFDEFFSASQ
jgi:hypothetical protein